MELRVLSDDDVLRLEAIGPIRGVDLTLESEATEQVMGGKTSPPMVLLSLETGRFIDSNGLAWLVAVNRRFGKMGGKIDRPLRSGEHPGPFENDATGPGVEPRRRRACGTPCDPRGISIE